MGDAAVSDAIERLRKLLAKERAYDDELAAFVVAYGADLLAELDGRWRPIQSAPKDGTELWLYAPDESPSQFVGRYEVSGEYGYWAYSEELVMQVVGEAGPTHWMPLPEPPK
jgi:hypothetical protein